MREQLRDKEKESVTLRLKVVEKNRMIDSLCTASKHLNISEGGNVGMEKARDSIERSERITKTINKSSFMNLGDKGPKLVSDEGSVISAGMGGRRSGLKSSCDDTYLTDDSVPSEIFILIQEYRERIINSRG